MRNGIYLEGLDEALNALNVAMPRELKKAAKLAISTTLQRLKAEGGRVARSAYTAKYPMRRVRVEMHSSGDGKSVLFYGPLGDRGWKFKTKPTFSSGLRRRPKEGVQVQVKKGGPWKTLHGPYGQKTFWLRGKNSGTPVIAYRTGQRRGLKGHYWWPTSSKNIFGASPIQAIARRESLERFKNMTDEIYKDELNRQIGRIEKGLWDK